jgi:trimeric autotransporter adhesin
VTFVTDMTGQVIRRDEADNNTNGSTSGDPHEIFYRYGGRELGYTGNNGTRDTDYETSIQNRTSTAATGAGAFFNNATGPTQYADFAQALAPVNSYSAAGAGGYTARAGDTLQGIAASLWGDASLWYLIAEANGLSGGGGLTEGQSLTIPPGILANGHSDTAFRPYDPGKALGDLSPTAVKPAKKPGGCGMVGQILMIAIAVAVSYFTAGALAGPTASLIATIGAGAVGGAAGSVASQAFGMATGIQSKFSWKGVAMGAISGAIGGGFGKLSQLATASRLTGTLAKVGNFLAGDSFINGAVRGLAGNVIQQGIGLATGLQDKFDWAGAAGAALGGGVGNLSQDLFKANSLRDLTFRNIAANVGATAASAAANAGVRS